ncbi:MAG: hypothetical protein PUC42_10890 [Bacteroidales bacterium]|nr:hypothetical protein [Bacteroidales bacterium]
MRLWRWRLPDAGTHLSFSRPQVPLRSVHAAIEIASYRRGIKSPMMR